MNFIRRNRDVSTPWISLRMFPYSTPTHNIANIALAPSCGNTLLFINDRRKCRSRLIIAYCVSNHFRIKSCDVAGDRKENWTYNDSDGRNFFNNNIFQLIDSSRIFLYPLEKDKLNVTRKERQPDKNWKNVIWFFSLEWWSWVWSNVNDISTMRTDTR